MANLECKYFRSAEGCRFGEKCRYLHSSRPTPPARPPIVSSSSSNINQPYKETSSNQQLKVSKDGHSINELWGFSDEVSGNEDGVYFYGAPGQFPSQKPAEGGVLPYSAIARLNVDPQVIESSNFAIKYDHPVELCKFYQLGNCRFGNYCRYSHNLDNTYNNNGESLPSSEETVYNNTNNETHQTSGTNNSDGLTIECGICIEAPASTLYGLLSHCDCKFCLVCIRNWRKEGLTIAKKADQVRLCPLCRTESYFVIPSGRYIIGEEKERLINTYKESLRRKPCRHFAAGECPFGTSCFYRHDDDNDGDNESSAKKGFRKLFKGDEEIVGMTSLRLSDYL